MGILFTKQNGNRRVVIVDQRLAAESQTFAGFGQRFLVLLMVGTEEKKKKESCS